MSCHQCISEERICLWEMPGIGYRIRAVSRAMDRTPSPRRPSGGCGASGIRHDAPEAVPAGLPVHSLSRDNGSEFAAFHMPWQRGCNGHVKGLLRFFFPKGCDSLAIPPAEGLRLPDNRPLPTGEPRRPPLFLHVPLANYRSL